MNRLTLLKTLSLIGLISLVCSAILLWMAFRLSDERRDIPVLVNIGMIVGVLGICCTTAFLWLWIRKRIVNTRLVRWLVSRSRGDS